MVKPTGQARRGNLPTQAAGPLSPNLRLGVEANREVGPGQLVLPQAAQEVRLVLDAVRGAEEPDG